MLMGILNTNTNIKGKYMDTQIKVSVIVPVYNAEEYLAQTADYIKNQTLQEIEIIYVDDGSTDGTLNILNELAGNDDRVTVLTQQNSYAGVARNNGLKKAKGKYVVFWDADDIFLPEALEEMYLQCEKDGADICICGASHYDEANGKTYLASTYLKTENIPEYTPFGHEEIDEYLFNFSTNVPWNKMYNRQFVMDNNITFQAVKRANDNYFVMLAYFYAKVFTVVDKELIHYRINYGTSITGGASEEPLSVYEAYKATYDKLVKEPGFERVRQSFINKTLRAYFYFLSKQTTVEGYEILYNYYKDNVFSQWEFPEEADYYYVPKDYERFVDVQKLSAIEFMMREYRMAFDNVRTLKSTKATLKSRTAAQKEKILVQKEKIAGLKLKNKELKADNRKLQAENKKLAKKLADIQQSFSYKLGRAITFVPRRIKKLL